MFPNVRLLIGTLFIAVLVLSCEFGVFAALRVSREPLSRLTAESAPLQLAAGQNARPAMTSSWATPRESHAVVKVAVPVEQVIDAPTSGTGGGVNEVTAAVAQPTPGPSPAAAPVRQPPAPPAVNAAAAPKELAPAQPAANVAPAQKLAAAPPSLTVAPTQQTPAAPANTPGPAQPAQSAPQAHESVAKASEPASSAPLAAAPAAAQPADITGSISNAATPDPAIPQAQVPLPKPAPKVAHKPVLTKARAAPTSAHRVIKKRVVRWARAPAAASSAQPDAAFNNPVFESAPQSRSPAKNRPGTKKAATNNSFGDPFATQLGTH